MRLLKLTLSNFKGITAFTLDTQGGNVTVYGDNALGKTTLFDAFLWLLFDKDSQNKKDFQIKTLDSRGQVLHGLSHEVEGVFDLNGRTLTFRKAFTEKWTKKRGSVKLEFTGHTTDYYIDGVPVQKKEYDSHIAGIADEGIFKLLTSPTYFNEQLHWQDRRKILLEVCGDLSDAEVIDSAVTLGNKDMLSLLNVLNTGRSLDDHRKVIAARRSEINKELEKIPVRIDEATRALPIIDGIDTLGLPSTIEIAKGQLKNKQEELARIQGGGEIAEKRRQLAEVEGDILRIVNELSSEQNAVIQKKYSDINVFKREVAAAQIDLGSAKRRMEAITTEASRLEAAIKEKRERWHKVNDEQFEYNSETVCPTCGQDLPEYMVEQAWEKALGSFNRDKAERLERINSEGKGLKKSLESLMAENSDLVTKANAAELKLQENEAEAIRLQTEIDALRDQAKPITDNPKYTQKQSEKEIIEKAIAQLQAGSEESTNTVQAEIEAITKDIETLETDLLKVKQRELGKKRIEELKAQEKNLAAEYEQLEKELYLTEQFIRSKVSLLEEKINSRFKYARFKMFDVQINGGVNECCETLYQGVPYTGGLNNAARINVGLDIINTLADYYGFNAPIFIDNREAVTRPIETVGQLISLVVSEPDKALRVETESKKYKEAS
ncbi:MAG: hypothetical protein NC238_09005 [Dehalobacter sp.]|nr:hypothetical protein [Dehalobacter sp.]